jgi:hypothetical protein
MNNPEQDGLARCWKKSRTERAGMESEGEDCRKKDETVNLSAIILEVSLMTQTT